MMITLECLGNRLLLIGDIDGQETDNDLYLGSLQKELSYGLHIKNVFDQI